MMLRRSLLACFLLGGIFACDNNVPSSPNYTELSGGSTSASGGNAGSGGHSDSGGSSGGVGSGGSGGSGGTTSAGGSVASGVSAGSSAGSGGTAVASGGTVTQTGGAGSGGFVSHGGTTGSGGSTASGAGGTTSSGGSGGSSTTHDAGPDTVSAVSYAKDIASMMKANCTSCHTGSRSPAGVDLSTYAGVKANASQANSAIRAGAMPPGGGLSATDKQLFQSWVTAGEPNN